jgi:RNA 3'-terminal phosphate cyclase (ATP)/RNA 3'-terminal phosphate cyclase (GTP)
VSNENAIEIDGAIGEGGGAILRLSAAYSILYNTPIYIKNIRANRPKPGLRVQHLLGLRLLAKLTGSNLSKCEVGSTEIRFHPEKKVKIREITIDIPTAASIGLLLQPIQIACLGLKSHEKILLKINGGATFGKWAPSINYLEHVTYPLFKKSGLNIEINTLKQGFYPKGGAQTLCSIKLPEKKLDSLNLTTLGDIESIHGEIIITNQLKQYKSNIPQRIKNSISSVLKGKNEYDLDLIEKWVDSLSPGVGLCLWANSNNNTYISSGTLLGERKLSSEQLGKMAIKSILKYINNDVPVDNYLSDQLIPLIAYIGQPSTIKILELTNHTKTNLELIRRFTKRVYKIRKKENAIFIEFY